MGVFWKGVAHFLVGVDQTGTNPGGSFVTMDIRHSLMMDTTAVPPLQPHPHPTRNARHLHHYEKPLLPPPHANPTLQQHPFSLPLSLCQ
mmetsp:Transcript_11984/g.19360  ORF Transcript_11984/g.19360 Transcript_11984/m.19360 type:complete len:89 (-) Transcript_11984:1526-1792(-)